MIRIALVTLSVLFLSSFANAGQLAIIIDDIGYNLALGRRTADLSGDFTLAILPFTPHGHELAERAHNRGKEIMLHVPMSSQHRLPLGRGGLLHGMQRAEFIAILRQNLANIPYVKGVNNHMGSLLTQEAEPMGWLMEELKIQQLYFVDSRTSAQTQALFMAESIKLPSRRRDIFLDDVQQSDKIRQQLLLAIKQAHLKGSAIAIGHPYPDTLNVLQEIRPLLEKYAVKLVKASALMRIAAKPYVKMPKKSYCLAPPSSLWPQLWLPVDPFAIDSLHRSMNMLQKN